MVNCVEQGRLGGRFVGRGQSGDCDNLNVIDKKGISCNLCVFSPLLVTYRRKPKFSVADSQLSSDFSLDAFDVYCLQKKKCSKKFRRWSSWVEWESTSRSSSLDVKRELLMLALPAIAGQAIDPLALLMETAYIARLGPVELGSAGVSISIFNIISKLFNIPPQCCNFLCG